MKYDNDKKILELKKEINDRQEKLNNNYKKFKPITNCIFYNTDDIKYNLHYLSKSDLVLLLIKLNSYKLSAKELGYDDFIISNFSCSDWISDIKEKLEIINNKNNLDELNILESKLTKLLSTDKAIELEIADIENFLNK